MNVVSIRPVAHAPAFFFIFVLCVPLSRARQPGCAGTGKSLVLNRILARLAEAGVTSGVYATATTGLAACHVKGMTLQQFAGIGKARGSGEEVLRVIKKRPDAVRRWKAARVRVGVCGGVWVVGRVILGRYVCWTTTNKFTHGHARPVWFSSATWVPRERGGP